VSRRVGPSAAARAALVNGMARARGWRFVLICAPECRGLTAQGRPATGGDDSTPVPAVTPTGVPQTGDGRGRAVATIESRRIGQNARVWRKPQWLRGVAGYDIRVVVCRRITPPPAARLLLGGKGYDIDVVGYAPEWACLAKTAVVTRG
jgi:hypothetical protein